jgi:hypothetical protein
VEFIGGGAAVLGAKNEALSPGRVPHVRLSVHGAKKTGRSPISDNLFGRRTKNSEKTLFFFLHLQLTTKPSS